MTRNGFRYFIFTGIFLLSAEFLLPNYVLAQVVASLVGTGVSGDRNNASLTAPIELGESGGLVSNTRTINPKFILAGIDSVTQEHFEYPDVLRTYLQKKYGNGGRGYISFDANYADGEQDIFTHSAGMTMIFNYFNFTSMPQAYSFNGMGVSVVSGSNNWINYEPYDANTADNCVLYYLQDSGGGSFVAGNAPVTNGTQYLPVTISTNGPRAVKAVTLLSKSGDPVLYVNHINGNVTLFGYSLINNSGVCFSRVAHGGNYAYYSSQVDSTAFSEWMGFLKPTAYIINAGLNDRKDINNSQFTNAIQTYINLIKTSAPSAKIILMNPNQSADYNSTFLPQFLTDFISLASF